MLKNYFIIAFRNFAKHKTFTLINLSGLAIALACSILIYLFIHHELTFDHFHVKKDRIYRVVAEEKNLTSGTQNFILPQPYPLGPAMQEDLPEVEAFVRTKGVFEKYVKKGNETFQEELMLADATLFEVFSFPLAYGSPDHALDRPDAIAISEKAARKYFGQSNPVGEFLSIRLNDTFEDYQVSAVFKEIPSNSSMRTDFFIPMMKENTSKLFDFVDNPKYNPWHASAFQTYILLHDKASRVSLEEKLALFRTKYFPDEADHLINWEKEKGEKLSRDYYLQPFTDMHLDPTIIDAFSPQSKSLYSYVLAGIALSILLLASINFTLLSISRSQGRAKEVGIRKVVGARRRQLMGQFWSEAILTSLFALLLALLLSSLTLPGFNQLAQKDLSLATLFHAKSMLTLLLITLATGTMAGAYPSLLLSGFNPLVIFKNRLLLGSTHKIARMLLAIQFVLPIFFLAITLAMINQLQYMRHKDLGFQHEQILVIENNAANRAHALKRFTDQARQRTEVADITATSVAFTHGETVFYMTDDPKHPPKDVIVYDVKPDFFSMLDIPLVEGRPFNAELSSDSTEAMIVNEALVKTFGWNNPIGKELEGSTVIGVVKDFHFQSLAKAIAPVAFYLSKNDDKLNYILIKLQPQDLKESLAELTKLWNRTVADVPFQYSFLDEDMQKLYEDDQRWSKILQWITSLSIFIACLGLLGVTGLTVANRTKEIGIRKVMGASVSSILLLLSKDYIKLILIACFAAIPVANYFITEWLQNFAYRTEIKWWLFTLPGILVLLMALLSVSGQTLKAARQNPVDSLRYE